MRLGEMAKKLRLEAVHSRGEDAVVAGGYTSDLLSDVLAHAKRGEVFITIQAHRNTIAVAQQAGIHAVIIAHNRPVPEDMIQAAREEGISIFRSPENQFVLSGKLYAALLSGGAR